MKNRKKKVGLHELYAKDPIEADRLLWGRESDPETRRGFLRKGALLAIGAALGAPMVYGKHFPAGMIPAGLAQEDAPFQIPGKHPDLIVLNDRPLNVETPAHLLDDKLTPADKFFIRNNGIPPEEDEINVNTWTLSIEGESVRQKKSYTIQELKDKFQHHTYALTLECGGNGRAEFNPPAKGNQWGIGAVACASWTGVRLKDVLNDVGLKGDAVYVGYEGMDRHVSGNPEKKPISRGVPMEKAMQDETIIAWAMNGQDIPYQNGHPLRLVTGGWPASTSGKWLTKLLVRNKVHDGPKMEAPSYRVPCKPVAPGTKVKDEDMCIIESMPVKSVITYPKTGASLKSGQKLPIRGHAWAGELSVEKMEYSIDFGATWKPAKLEAAANRLAWQHFNAEVSFPEKGYYEVWARATDSRGTAQPMILPGWNPKGYLNNACHRIAVKVI
ncbi:sulfite oxidase [Phaeodactylibacter xiamenensis]|jgi:DMSO/TMAO reductase YedYZ molybdopterin-dependent catalytic subunit|uniref:sulfite oxidase n=1 Tax=Phaeodactylibacter xiamenensis TaxID=1524460 RepID=UPI0024A9BFD2|nr:sulfite oxidase [Phaeodactylibacter xiamenensis]